MNGIQRGIGAAVALLALAFVPMARAADEAPAPPPAARSSAGTGAETGLAAVYTDRLHGRTTASGERYDRRRFTAAHNTLPFGTKVRVTSARTHKSVVVRINDRGPTQAGRILDLSPASARAIGIRPNAMGRVTATVVGHAPKHARHRKAAAG